MERFKANCAFVLLMLTAAGVGFCGSYIFTPTDPSSWTVGKKHTCNGVSDLPENYYLTVKFEVHTGTDWYELESYSAKVNKGTPDNTWGDITIEPSTSYDKSKSYRVALYYGSTLLDTSGITLTDPP